MTWILGVNAPPTGWHDSAACLLDGDGEIIAFSEEERCNRHRHSLYRKPLSAARFCLEQAGISPADIDVVALGWDSEQLYPRRFADDAAFLAYAVGLDFGDRIPEVVRVPHHQAHAASSFYASPFSKAGVLVIDGHGENESSTIWTYEDGAEPRLERTWQRTASLGYAYDAASTWLGFSFLNAGKTMGLAAYGRAANSTWNPSWSSRPRTSASPSNRSPRAGGAPPPRRSGSTTTPSSAGGGSAIRRSPARTARALPRSGSPRTRTPSSSPTPRSASSRRPSPISPR